MSNRKIIKKYKNTALRAALCAITLIILAPNSAKSASEIIVSQRLLRNELSGGYTIEIPDKDAQINILPNTLNRSAFVEIIKPAYFPSAPMDKTLISPVYHYSILPATNNKLSDEITLNLKFPSSDARWKEIYIYNQELGDWQHIGGIENLHSGKIAAQTNWASGFIAVFADHLDKSEYLKADINSQSILVADAKTGEILLERLSARQRPIASLTKLMTAAVFLNHNPGWNTKISIAASDDAIPAKIYVNPGDVLTTKNLFYATMLKSANNAANALARSTGLPRKEFVKEMNKKARQLGMDNTHFVEVTGLSEKNVSTAQDYLKLSKKIFSDMIFLRATTPKQLTISNLNNGKKHILKNSNKTIDVPYRVLGSKTGFTNEAGRCLVMKVKNKSKREVIAVTLGADTPGAQWQDMRKILNAALFE